MDQWWTLTVGGIASGAVYAALGLSLVIIFRATRVVNFAQPALALLSTYLAFTVNQATGGYWLGFAVAIVAGGVLGAVADRLLVRPARDHGELGSVIVTLGLLLVAQAIAGMFWTSEPRSFGYAFDFRGLFSAAGVFAVLVVLADRGRGARAVQVHLAGAAHARGRVRAGGGEPRRRAGRAHGHRRRGARRGGRRARRVARGPAAALPDRPRRDLRLRADRRGRRRAGQPDRHRRRRVHRRHRTVLRVRLPRAGAGDAGLARDPRRRADRCGPTGCSGAASRGGSDEPPRAARIARPFSRSRGSSCSPPSCRPTPTSRSRPSATTSSRSPGSRCSPAPTGRSPWGTARSCSSARTPWRCW